MGQTAVAPRFTGRSSGVSGLRRHLNLLANADPEAIRTEVIAQGREPFVDGLLEALREPGYYCAECKRSGRERWAFRLYAELAKMVGIAPQIAVQIVNLVGAPPDVARQAVETVRTVEHMSDRDMAREGLRIAHDYCAREGITLDELRGSSAEVET